MAYKMRFFENLQLTLFGALLIATPIYAASSDVPGRFTVDRYLELQQASDPRVSPDGTQVLYTRTRFDQIKDQRETTLWLVDANGQHHRFMAKGQGAVWSPDGKRIAYLSDVQPQGLEIFVLDPAAPASATQITWGSRSPANLRWSPDGAHIGFTMVVANPEKWSINLPAAPNGSRWADAPRFTERLHYRRDGVGFTERGFRHLFMVAADGGALRQVTSGEWNLGESVYEYIDTVDWAFTPDGHSAIVEGFKEGDQDRNDQDCYIYSVDLQSGGTKRLISTTGSWRRPALSPDGKTIAYVGFLKNGDGYRISDLYTMSVDGSNSTLRSGGFDREPEHLVWAPDSSAVYFTAEDRGSVHLYSWSTHGGIKQLTTGWEVVNKPSASRNSIVAVRSAPELPGDVEVINTRAPNVGRRLTHLNDDLLRGIQLSKVDEVQFDSTGGAHIQGWVVRPPDFDPSRRYPLVLEIHGGPYGMFNVGFNPAFQNFAANGYILLYVNPRGSTGYGGAFSDAIAKNYPGPDYDDLMAGVDTVIKQGNVDESHMFVTGCSGGGVLSSWVIGHTNRFAAAAVRCPVTDWISMAGQTDIPNFTYRFFKKPFWEDPSDWLARSSLMQVGKVQTPTLLMTGELDRRTPIAQTEEYYAALKYRGVPTAMLRFDGEYHGTAEAKPSNWMRTQLYMMSWFQRYGGNPAGPAPR